jgi:hypothetical protein
MQNPGAVIYLSGGKPSVRDAERVAHDAFSASAFAATVTARIIART